MNCYDSYQNDAPVYYYHPDHLGSTSWVTDEAGNEHQFIAYLPYGEPLLNVLYDNYDSRYGLIKDARYKFTGKKRDAETGYDYMEQRYYYPPLAFWLHPDPLLDKYIHLSSYAYCNGNPLKYVDPDGEEAMISFVISNNPNIQSAQERNKNEQLIKRATMSPLNSINNEYTFIWAHGSKDGSALEYAAKSADVYGNIETISSKISSSSLYGILMEYNKSFKKDPQNSIIIFLSCNTGKNDGSLACEFSTQTSGSVVIAPTNKVAVDSKGRVRVKNNGHWNVYVDGKIVDTIKGDKGESDKFLIENNNKETLLQKYANYEIVG